MHSGLPGIIWKKKSDLWAHHGEHHFDDGYNKKRMFIDMISPRMMNRPLLLKYIPSYEKYKSTILPVVGGCNSQENKECRCKMLEVDAVIECP